MTLYDVVTKIIGPIDPIEEANEDAERFLNLQSMTDLVDKLLSDIDNVSYINRNKKAFSCKKASEFAKNFIDKINISD